jgi:hypothetical protein
MCKWHRSPVGANYLSNLGFHDVADGDELIESEFAEYGLPFADVATVRFMFGTDGNLKEVKARIWSGSL